MAISVTVCLFVCTVTDFSGEDKASGVKFCTVVQGRLGQGISHFVELCSPGSPKSDESASHREVDFHKGRHTTNVTLEVRRSWNMARRVDVGTCGYRPVPTGVLVRFLCVFVRLWISATVTVFVTV